MSEININNLQSVTGTENQPVILVDGVAFPVGLRIESGTDLSEVTVTADKMLAGVIAIDADGNQVVGTIETVSAEVSGNAVTIPAGYNATAQTVTVGTAKGAETYTPSTADQTIAADTYLSGVQTIKGDANLIADNIAEGVSIFGVAGTHTGGGESVAYGYIDADGNFQPTDVDSAPPVADGSAVSANLVTFALPDGIVEPVSPGTGGSMDFYKCAAVYSPDEVETVIISGCPTEDVNGTYLPTEFTTLDDDSNTQPVYSNGSYYYYFDLGRMGWVISTDYKTYNNYLYSAAIGGTCMDNSYSRVEGMSAANGTATMGAKTWDGYKAVLTDGVYSFEETLTEGLTYGTAFAPVVDSIYNQDCSIFVNRLYHGGLPYIPVFSDGLQVVSAAADSGQALSVTGNPSVSGNAVMFPAGSYMQCNTPILNGATEFTYFFIAKTDGSGSDAHLIKDTYDDDYWRVCITYDYNNDNVISAHVRNAVTGETSTRIQIDGNRGLVADTECAIALVYSVNEIVLYADGVVIGREDGSAALLDKDTVLNYGSTYNSRTAVTMRQLHIFDKALTAEEINLLCELYK